MKIPDFIEKAIEGGWEMPTRVKNSHEFIIQESGKAPEKYSILEGTDVFLDPLAWKAVGKVEEWEDEWNGQYTAESVGHRMIMEDGWLYNMHRMIDALAEGKTITEYIETL